MPEALIRGFTSAYRWALNRPYAPALFALMSLAPLTVVRGNLKDCDGFTPEPLILSAYIGPFLFGWVLYHNRDLLPRFEGHIRDLRRSRGRGISGVRTRFRTNPTNYTPNHYGSFVRI